MKIIAVILTTAATGTPHLETMRAHNPGLEIEVHEAVQPPGETLRREAWRNCDRNILRWWDEAKFRTDADYVLALEYDVFANVALVDTLPQNPPDVLAARLAHPVRDGRSWPPFRELCKLPAAMRQMACGVVPLAVLGLSRRALEEFSHPAWEALLGADIFCELRLATIAATAGLKMAENPQWKHVGTCPVLPPAGFRGIIHPVKMEVAI